MRLRNSAACLHKSEDNQVNGFYESGKNKELGFNAFAIFIAHENHNHGIEDPSAGNLRYH